MKNMLYGTADQEPHSESCAQLAQEMYNNNMLLLLIQNLHRIDFEVCTVLYFVYGVLSHAYFMLEVCHSKTFALQPTSQCHWTNLFCGTIVALFVTWHNSVCVLNTLSFWKSSVSNDAYLCMRPWCVIRERRTQHKYSTMFYADRLVHALRPSTTFAPIQTSYTCWWKGKQSSNRTAQLSYAYFNASFNIECVEALFFLIVCKTIVKWLRHAFYFIK